MDWGRKNRIAREAAQWVVLIDGPSFDAAAADRFRRWLARSPDHPSAFQLASRTWTDLDQLGALKAYPDIVEHLKAPAGAAGTSPSVASDRSVPRRALLVGAGAGAVALSLAGYAAFAPGPAVAYETAIGEKREVSLPDGTRVIMNAATRFEARIDGERRKVRMLAGEALFAISPNDAAGVFSIATPSGEIEAASGDVLVKLLPEGRARIALLSDGARALRRGPIGIGRSSPVVAGPGSEIVFGDEELAIEAPTADELARRVLWREGMLAFDDTPLSEAVADMSRQSGVRFRFADRALAEVRVGGLVRADDMGAFLDLLQNNLAISAERRDGEIVLSASER
jgi:transmembrane sensor